MNECLEIVARVLCEDAGWESDEDSPEQIAADEDVTQRAWRDYVDPATRILKALSEHLRDAERYRWLRDKAVHSRYFNVVYVSNTRDSMVRGADCDTLVDAAIAFDKEMEERR
jgi:hypothetical protein